MPYSRLIWNAAAQRYVTPQGRFISTKAVRAIIDQDIDAASQRMVGHGDKLKQAAQAFKDGAITDEQYRDAVRNWRNSMAADIKAQHLGQGAAAVGGFHAMQPKHTGAIGGRLRVQYAYLSNFAVEAAASPDIVLSLDKSRRPFDERVAAYGEASRETFEALQESENFDAGLVYVENDEEPTAHHCQGPESCPAMTALGRVRIDDPRWRRVGKRKCKFKCRCKSRYYKSLAV